MEVLTQTAQPTAPGANPLHLDVVMATLTLGKSATMEQTTVHLNRTAMQPATNARLQVLLSKRPVPAKPATRIRSSISVQSQRAVSIPQVGMIIVLAELDTELMGCRRRIPSSSDWRFRDRSTGFLLRRE
jgi:hypothetical protein